MSEIKKGLDILKHCLGAVKNNPRRAWGFRNYCFFHKEEPVCEQLVNEGLMHKVDRLREDGSRKAVTYHATELGAYYAGLYKTTIKRMKKEKEICK